MNFITDARIAAAKKFNPKNLCEHLVEVDDGIVIVDRTKILKNEYDERLFMIVMNADYGWNYKDYEHSAIYFRVSNGDIVGGIYNTELHMEVSHRKVASSKEKTEGLTRQYVYNAPTLKTMCEAIIGV